MASILTHAAVALGLGDVVYGGKRPASFWIASAACSILPDADAIGFRLGIPYASAFGHRGFTHSLLFALLVGAVASGFRGWKLLLYFFAVTASHGVLDALTNGGLGVEFFWPFDTARYFFPWRPVQVSPIGISAFIGRWGLKVLATEFLYVWIPVGVAVSIARRWLGRRGAGDRPSP